MGPWLDAPVLLALPVGVAFGVLLERGGLASARTITDQLALRDFTVVKVMLTAIVTAMLGVFWAERLGWLSMAGVGIPATDIVPQLVGAIVFGVGFALSSLCPGTACAAVGAGRIDGVAVVGGLFVGTLGVMLVWPGLGTIAQRAPRDAAQLPTDLGIPVGMVVAFITVVAVIVLPRLARFEGQVSNVRRLTPLSAVALSLGLLAIPASGLSGRAAGAEYAAIAREISSEVDHVEPLDLAEWIRDNRPGLRVIDVREVVSEQDYVIPGAEHVPLAAVVRLEVSAGEHVVLYSDGGSHAAQAWVLLRAQRVRNVTVLHDGLAGWEDEVMAPMPPRPGDAADSTRWTRARALTAWFGGAPRPHREGASPTTPRSRRRNTC